MKGTPYILLRGLRCHPDDVAKFEKWYDEVHIPMLMKYKGIVSIVRGKAVVDKEKYPTYLGLMTFESKEAADGYETCEALAEAKKEAAVTWKDRPFTSVWRALYEVKRSWPK